MPFTLAHRKGLTPVQVLGRRAQVLLYRYPVQVLDITYASSRYHIRKFYRSLPLTIIIQVPARNTSFQRRRNYRGNLGNYGAVWNRPDRYTIYLSIYLWRFTLPPGL